MNKPELIIANLGPIPQASISFGDLTVFVGPQASGKSVALQCVKLLADAPSIRHQLKAYGTDWSRSPDQFLDAYFGEGMHTLWQKNTQLMWYGHEATPASILRKRSSKTNEDRETVFLIPAQRVMTLRDGWPRPFADYRAGDPYAVRSYSEKLRILMEREFRIGSLFPKANRLKSEYRDLLAKSIFGGFSLDVSIQHSQKRLVLQQGASAEDALPYMVWSAGQREFVPLLLGLYWLMPPSKVATRHDIHWVILEEPEMGLHPRAISTLLLMVLELMARGYKVCSSTHSPQVLKDHLLITMTPK